MEESTKEIPSEIVFAEQIFDIDFHPTQDVIAVGLINGLIQMYIFYLVFRYLFNKISIW